MRVLITGANGFAGGHLARKLQETTPDLTLWGAGLQAPTAALAPLFQQFRTLDFRDADGVAALIDEARPDHIYHLVAQASPAKSLTAVWPTFEINIRCQLNVLEVLRAQNASTRVLLVTSAEVYGRTSDNEKPVDEQFPFAPVNPYAISKVAQDLLGSQYANVWQVDVVIARPFNHMGPGQTPQFVGPAFAGQVARIEAGLQPPVMRVGNLNSVRDFSDVRDIAAAYVLLMQHGRSGEAYNLGSGMLRPVRQILDELLAATDQDIRVEVDQSLIRAVDPPGLHANTEKVRAATGWTPTIDFSTTIRDLLAYERERLQLQIAYGKDQAT